MGRGLRASESTYQSCSRTVRSSRYMVLERKSIPIVACQIKTRHKTSDTKLRHQNRQSSHASCTPHQASSKTTDGMTNHRQKVCTMPSNRTTLCPEKEGLTWYVLSNLSYMNRVMILVLPDKHRATPTQKTRNVFKNHRRALYAKIIMRR